MKSHLSVLILFAVILLGACKKNNDDKDNPGGGGGTPDKIEMGSTPWPCFYQNMQGTNLSPYNATTTIPKQKWYKKISSQVFKSCIMGADGTIFINDPNKVYAVNSADGAVKWTYDTKISLSASPVIDKNGILYVSGFQMTTTSDLTGFVFAINAKDGTLKWKFSSPELTNGGFYESPTIGLEGYLYVPERLSKTLYALNTKGEIAWKYVAKRLLWGTPVIGPDSTIYQSAYEGSDVTGALYAIRPGGTLKWEYTAGGYFTPAVILTNGKICFASGIVMHWIDKNKGYIAQKSMETVSEIYSGFATGTTNIVYMTAPALGALNLYAMDQGIESYSSIVSYGGIPVLGQDGTIYTSYNSRIYSCKALDGEKLWQYDLPSGVNNGSGKTIIGSDGVIYMGLSNGYMIALSK